MIVGGRDGVLMVTKLIKDSSNEGFKWHFHASLWASSYLTALASTAEQREMEMEEAQLEGLCQYSKKWLIVVKANPDPSCNLNTFADHGVSC